MYLFGCTIGIHYDARTCEHQMEVFVFYTYFGIIKIRDTERDERRDSVDYVCK